MSIHALTDYISLFVGFQLYLHFNKSSLMVTREKLVYIIGALTGALIGSRLLAYLADPQLWDSINFISVIQNKTIIGGIIGGIIGIEIAKKILGITRKTGDSTVIPLLIAIFIGRIGCELAGVSDGTIGGPCDYPWCFMQGDPVPRHPLPLYEMSALLVSLPFVYYGYLNKIFKEGILFRLFIIGYFSLRFLLEYLKENQFILFHLSIIQWVCLAVCVFYLYDIGRVFQTSEN